MIDLQTETPITFSEASHLIPSRPHLSQLYRWSMSGLRGVKLEWIQIGGKRYTSKEALNRFFAALTRAAGGEAPAPTPTATRKRQIARAQAELASV